jgi:hypothetical protein
MKSFGRDWTNPLLFIEDDRVIHRLPLSILSSNGVRPRLAIAESDAGSRERLPHSGYILMV